MSLSPRRKLSTRQVEANRRNGRKSKGPRTPEGKQRVTHNALKHGLHAEPVVQAMLAIGEKPRAYYRLLAQLAASLRPANPHQQMQVEDIANLRWEKARLERARLALIAGKMRHLKQGRDHRLLEFDCDAPHQPQAELLEKGLDRAPDSPPKFEKMLSCLNVLINVAKQDQFALDPEPELNLLYGEQPSLEGAYLRNVFRRFRTAQNGAEGSGSGIRQPQQHEGDGRAEQNSLERSMQDPKSKIQHADGAPSEQERMLLLKTLFAAKQRTLRLYQFYNRQFVEITPDQRDACYAPSDETDVCLMRREAQNDRQLRFALKLYWQTQKEDAARASQFGGKAGEADKLMADLEKSIEDVFRSSRLGVQSPELGDSGPESVPKSELPILDSEFAEQQSHQVTEKTGEVSGIGQNDPNFAHPIGQVPNPGPLVEGARPKVKELLEQMQSDPEARALVETFLLNQMVQEESLREEAELAALQRERQKREVLEQNLEQMVAAQQELESRNRQLRAQVGESEITHQQVREQIKPAGAVVVKRREPTHQEILAKINAAIGVGLPLKYRIESQVEGMPGYHLTEEQYRDYLQGRGPAWEEELRRREEAAARSPKLKE